MGEESIDLTQMLADAGADQPAEVAKRLMPPVYGELRALAER